MKCPTCGTEIQPGQKYCPSCGAVPGIFVVSVAIVEPLFFDSLLGDGFPLDTGAAGVLVPAAVFEEALVLVWAVPGGRCGDLDGTAGDDGDEKRE